jgi:hypothetical protein
MRITDIERSFGELLAAVGHVVVARTRGTPTTPDGGSIATVVRQYRSRRRTFDRMLRDIDTVAGDDARAPENMRAVLAVVDGLEPTPSVRATAGEPRASADLLESFRRPAHNRGAPRRPAAERLAASGQIWTSTRASIATARKSRLR